MPRSGPFASGMEWETRCATDLTTIQRYVEAPDEVQRALRDPVPRGLRTKPNA